MAYTITATPFLYAPVHGDLVYTVAYPEHTSDPVTYPDFKFIGDVYVGGVLVARIKKVPDPSTGIGIFNVGQIVRSYMATAFNPAGGVLVAQEMGVTDFRLSVQMKFGEEYTGTTNLNVVSDTARNFFNAYNGRRITSSLLFDVTDKMASFQPSYGYLQLTNQFYFVPFFPTTTGAISFSVAPVGGGSGFSTTITPAAGFNMLLINVSPVALNLAHTGTITAATTSYVVTIAGVQHTFYLFCEAQYQVYTIHFLNQHGGFDTKLFSKLSRISTDQNKTSYGKLLYTVDGSGNVNYKNANGVVNESMAIYANQYKEKWQLNTDFLTDYEFQWLNNLMSSPMVYLEDSGLFYPVQITDTSYETHKVVNDDVGNLTINIEFGMQLNTQYR